MGITSAALHSGVLLPQRAFAGDGVRAAHSYTVQNQDMHCTHGRNGREMHAPQASLDGTKSDQLNQMLCDRLRY